MTPDSVQPGLRERKKQQARAAIAKAATDLFRERGFEGVTVEQIAIAADVSRQTIFNYFRSKEEMLFDRDAAVAGALIGALRGRPAGSSVVAVFRTHTRRFWERVSGLAGSAPTPEEWWSIIEKSPALREYAEIVFARLARLVALELASERGAPDDDPESHAFARALCGVNAAILTSGLHRLTRGDDPAAVAAAMLVATDRAYDLFEHDVSTTSALPGVL
jgi:AcrR family transcriptional regulator